MWNERGDEELEGLVVLALEGVPGAFAEAFCTALSRRVAVPCRLQGAPPGLEIPRLAHRDQVDADRLLARLEATPRPSGHWVVGLTAQDLGHPIFTFFFGRARHHAGTALVSIARLSPASQGLPDDPRTTLRRALAEALHELGHVAGCRHCQDNACVMRFVTTAEGIDNRGDTFCSACAPALPTAFRPSTSR